MPRFRPTARLLVLDPADRVLLFSATDPRGQVWFTPGGGVHRGESLEAAAVRELAEETGHVRAEADIGPLVATCSGLRATGDRIVPYGLSDLVDRLVSDGVPARPVRLPWRLGT